MMKLITEEIESVEVLTETVNGKKTLYIQGPFLQSECVNRNGRMYPFSIMEREVKRYTEQYVDKGRALGELGHPDGPSVNLDRVSHKIVELRAEGTNFYGKARILDTPMGKIAKSLLDEGVKLGVSSREPMPLEETPSLTPSSRSDLAILPIGVFRIFAFPIKLVPSSLRERIRCDTRSRFTVGPSG